MSQVIGTLIDFLFTATGVVITFERILRRRKEVFDRQIPPSSFLEIGATLVALACAAVGPNILIVATTPGLIKMPFLSKFFLMPSIALLVVIALLAAQTQKERLLNRIWAGFWIGAVATGTLDVVRLTGFHLGLMPGNMPRMFGVLILNRMALGPSPISDLIGYFYHYWVGACFGLTYTLLCGRTRWWGGLIWGLLIEVGMMTTPPMVVAMDTGYFGLKKGFGLLGTSLIAHIVFGICLGLLVEGYVRHRGSIFSLIQVARDRLCGCQAR